MVKKAEQWNKPYRLEETFMYKTRLLKPKRFSYKVIRQLKATHRLWLAFILRMSSEQVIRRIEAQNNTQAHKRSLNPSALVFRS